MPLFSDGTQALQPFSRGGFASINGIASLANETGAV